MKTCRIKVITFNSYSNFFRKTSYQFILILPKNFSSILQLSTNMSGFNKLSYAIQREKNTKFHLGIKK